MADRNYLKQTQGDADSADALKHTEVINVTIGADQRVGPYYPGNARSVFLVTTGNCKFEMRGSGGTNGLGADVFRDVVLTSEATTAVAASDRVGHLDGGAIPHEFYLLDTSGSSNPTTMYINY
tara:strand:+ start:38 stop:406 length:369 start_codon:yes stop_codon:yes gene_type:complete